MPPAQECLALADIESHVMQLRVAIRNYGRQQRAAIRMQVRHSAVAALPTDSASRCTDVLPGD
jgi:hypothetical protein